MFEKEGSGRNFEITWIVNDGCITVLNISKISKHLKKFGKWQNFWKIAKILENGKKHKFALISETDIFGSHELSMIKP